jgi:hypothetical protein
MRYAKHNLREKKQLTVTAPELNGPNFRFGHDTGTSYDSWPDEKLYLSDMDDISAEEDESETTMSDTKDQSQYTRKRKRLNAASSLDSQTKHTAHYPPDLERTSLTNEWQRGDELNSMGHNCPLRKERRLRSAILQERTKC